MTHPKLTPEEQVRLLRTDASSYGATDIPAMEARNHTLNALYYLDGRHSPQHPHHGTFTGLWQATNS